MAKKKIKIKFLNDAPVTFSFAVIAILLAVLDTFVFKHKLNNSVLFTPTTAQGTFPFAVSDFYSYLRLFLHIFGFNSEYTLVLNLTFVLLLGQEMEKKYGSVIIALMMGVASIVTGVLCAVTCKLPCRGASAIVFMLLVLNGLAFVSKNTISLASIGVFALFIAKEIIQKPENGILAVVISLAGGVCGSLFAFLASPTARKTRKENITVESYEAPKKSLFGRKKEKSSASDSEETVIGELKF